MDFEDTGSASDLLNFNEPMVLTKDTPYLLEILENLQIGTNLEIRDGDKKPLKTSIKDVVIFTDAGYIVDIEFILNVSRNNYFSATKFAEGRSWVKEIKVFSTRDRQVKPKRVRTQMHFPSYTILDIPRGILILK